MISLFCRCILSVQWAFVLVACFNPGYAVADEVTQAQSEAITLAERMTGAPLSLFDPRLPVLANLIESNQREAAAWILADDPVLPAVRASYLGATMSNVGRSAQVPMNDLSSTLMGFVRDGTDARKLLTGDFLYLPETRANDPAGEALRNSFRQFTTSLKQIPNDIPGLTDRSQIAGVLHSTAWAKAHYSGGTNRRAVKYAFEEFLCTPLDNLRDFSLSPDFIRRDVTRTPGERFEVFQNKCKGCHSGMDAVGGAFARIDFVGSRLTYFGNKIAPKMNQNSSVWPDGWTVTDDSWENLWVKNHNEKLGWRGPTRGKGLNAFGVMLSNSEAFSRCMSRKIYKEVCKELPDPNEEALLAASFEDAGYNLKRLFVNSALSSQCAARRSGKIKRFDELLTSVAALTGVGDLELRQKSQYEERLRVQLPQSNESSALTGTSLLAITKLSAAACKLLVRRELATPDANRSLPISDRDFRMAPRFGPMLVKWAHKNAETVARYFTGRFWNRPVLANERNALIQELEAAAARATSPEPMNVEQWLTLGCTSSLVSMDLIFLR